MGQLVILHVIHSVLLEARNFKIGQWILTFSLHVHLNPYFRALGQQQRHVWNKQLPYKILLYYYLCLIWYYCYFRAVESGILHPDGGIIEILKYKQVIKHQRFFFAVQLTTFKLCAKIQVYIQEHFLLSLKPIYP